MQEFSLIAPQHPKNATKKITKPTITSITAALFGASLMRSLQSPILAIVVNPAYNKRMPKIYNKSNKSILSFLMSFSFIWAQIIFKSMSNYLKRIAFNLVLEYMYILVYKKRRQCVSTSNAKQIIECIPITLRLHSNKI